MFKYATLAMAITMFPAAVFPADISTIGEDRDGRVLIQVSGDIEADDKRKFATAIDGVKEAVVFLQSNGGDLQAGLDIGSRIRLMGFATAVRDGQSCYSSCAIAWLGGTKRYIGTDAHVNFHAAYVLKDGNAEESGVANALVGSYFTKLGLNEEAVIFLTSAPPDDFNELDTDWAGRLGIDVQFGSTADLQIVDAQTTSSKKDPYGITTMTAHDVSDVEARANAGDSKAQMTAGLLYATGDNPLVAQDYATSNYWFQKAADQGLAQAQFALSVHYRQGRAVAVNNEKAISLLRQAAQQGYKRAQKALVEIYLQGQITPKNEPEANIWLGKLADSGDAWGQFLIGRNLLYGNGIAVDEREAAKYFLKSAEQGYANAQYAIAKAYQNAQGVPVDYDQAFSWMKKAAENDHIYAQYDLSLMYEAGIGVDKNDALAAKWMSTAAVNGNDFANYWVAVNFSRGEGVQVSDRNAVTYILKFLKSKSFLSTKNERANDFVNTYHGHWTPETIAELQRRLAEMGYYDRAIDGAWGASTAAAVTAFFNAEAK